MAENEQPVSTDSEANMDDRIASMLMGGEQAEEQEQAQPEQADEQAQVQDGQAQTEPAQPELVDVDFSGKQYKLPPELKDALMAQKDYTQKTQEVAEQRKMVELKAQTMQQQMQFQQAVSQELQTLGHLDMEIARYNKLDWASLDTDTLVRARHALDQLKDQKAEIQKTVQDKKAQFDQQFATINQQMIERGTEYLKRVIPSWGETAQKEVVSYGLKEGYTDVQLSRLNDPIIIKSLWKAAQWDKLQSQKGATQQKANAAPPVVKPGASTPNSKAEQNRNYREQLAKAKTPSAKLRILDDRIAQKFGI